jgi:hypothetical protein
MRLSDVTPLCTFRELEQAPLHSACTVLAAESINNWLMTTFALNNLWAYLQGLSLSQNDREWLANKLIMPKETNLVEDDNARLDEALAKFSGDFGGSADAMTVAEELRQGAEMVKEVETW